MTQNENKYSNYVAIWNMIGFLSRASRFPMESSDIVSLPEFKKLYKKLEANHHK